MTITKIVRNRASQFIACLLVSLDSSELTLFILKYGIYVKKFFMSGTEYLLTIQFFPTINIL